MESQPLQINWLHGIRVVLIGNYVPAPFAAYLLRALGAEIIKVEQGPGDHLRYVGTLQGSPAATSPMFRMLNAGFKSIALQWRQPKGAAILRQLLETADIFLDGSRRGAVEQALGMPPEAVSAHLIYVPITAYGQVGPMADLGGHDNNILALAGNLSYTQTTAEGRPTVFSAPVADMFAGQMAAFGALAAIIGRQTQKPKHPGVDTPNLQPQFHDLTSTNPEALNSSPPQQLPPDAHTPQPQQLPPDTHTLQLQQLPPDAHTLPPRTLDASMLHAGFFMNFMELASMNIPGTSEPQAGNAWMNGGRPDYRPYKTSDGKYVFFGLIEAWALTRFFKAIGKPELIDSISNPDTLHSQLETIFSQKTQSEWVAIGTLHDACITPVNNLSEATKEPQIQALQLIQSVQDPTFGSMQLPTYPLGFGKNSQQPTLPPSAPNLGQHTHEILKEVLHLTEAAIATLLEDKTIQTPPPQQ